jgi:hypothetical protein
MKVVLSRISGSGDNIEEFMKKVGDDDVSPTSSLSEKCQKRDQNLFNVVEAGQTQRLLSPYLS